MRMTTAQKLPTGLMNRLFVKAATEIPFLTDAGLRTCGVEYPGYRMLIVSVRRLSIVG
jgi:hypothetical protein